MIETKPKRRWFKFSIRDMLLVTLVIGLALGWWCDRRRLLVEIDARKVSQINELTSGQRFRDFHVQRITKMLESAERIAPSSEVAAEVFELIRHHPDFTLKVRAMAIVPFLTEREQAIDVLIEATRDREDERRGSGNVPSYAVTYLTEMKATRAINAVENWLAFLKQQRPYDDQVRRMLLQSAEKRLSTLKGYAEPGVR